MPFDFVGDIMHCQARIEVECRDVRDAEIIMAALMPECRYQPRTEVDIHRDKNRIIVFIDASDISALRASINSYMRWIYMALRVIGCVEECCNGSA